jgi:transposase
MPLHSSMSDERNAAMRERIEELLASGNTNALVELFSGLAARADTETARADTETARADTETARADTEAARAAEFVEQADELGEKVRRLEIRVKHLTRLLFGRRSEKLTQDDLAQLVLAFDGTVEEGQALEVPTPPPPEERDEEAPEGERPGKGTKKRRPNHRGRTALSADIERKIHVVEVPEQERACNQCGQMMHVIDYLDHETVEYIPAHFVVEVERREKLACKNKCCRGDAVTADRKEQPTVSTRVGASVLAHLIESKCDDALPIYRQRDQFHRLGFDIPLNTLYSNWAYALDLLAPVATVTLGTILDEDIVRIDDTSMPVVDKSKSSGKFRGHLWAFKGTSKLVAYQFTETWEAEEIRPWIIAITGFIQVDDYKGYSTQVPDDDNEPSSSDKSSVKLVPDERRLGCMMHVRRRFYDAFKLGDARAGPALENIRALYKLEAKAKIENLGPSERLEQRTRESLPILASFYKWATELEPNLGKTSTLAEAVRYAIQQRPYVERCFSDGRFEIDNGEIERVLREPCLGRKNFLHAGSVAGAKRLATAYTLVQSCRALGISTRDYLIDVITKIARGWPMSRICELIPDRWARDRGLLPTTNKASE